MCKRDDNWLGGKAGSMKLVCKWVSCSTSRSTQASFRNSHKKKKKNKKSKASCFFYLKDKKEGGWRWIIISVIIYCTPPYYRIREGSLIGRIELKIVQAVLVHQRVVDYAGVATRRPDGSVARLFRCRLLAPRLKGKGG